MVTEKKFKTVAIIGGGLIGSSLAHSIRENHLCDNLKIFDSKADVRKKLKEIFNSQEIYENLNETVTEADLVFLCIPVGSMRDVAKKISNLLKKGCILTDTGSTKNSVINDVNPYIPMNVNFIPSHPLAGTEYSGPKSGFSSLFENRYWLIVNDKKTGQTKKLANFFESLGSIVETVSAEYHDKILAITSHLPHLIAYTIVGTASDLETDLKNDVIKFSASGFRDFTRIAASDPIMWRDVFLNNSEAVLEMLQRFNEDLSDLQKAIRKKQGQKLHSFFSRTRSIRKKIIEAGQN